MPKELPIVISLVVCDQAYVDPVSNRISLLGLFSEIESRWFPFRHELFHVAVELTNGRGRMRIRAVLVRTTAESLYGHEVTQQALTVEFPEPRARISLGLNFRLTTFAQPGEYRVLVMAGAELLTELRLDVIQHPES